MTTAIPAPAASPPRQLVATPQRSTSRQQRRSRRVSASVGMAEANAALSTGGQLSVTDVDSAATFVAQAGTVAVRHLQHRCRRHLDLRHGRRPRRARGWPTVCRDLRRCDRRRHRSSVTVTITGSNDAAVVSSASVALTETNAARSTGGQLTISDVDSAATFVAQAGTAGVRHLRCDRRRHLDLHDGRRPRRVRGGQQYVETFAVASADGTQQRHVTITGSNDAAVVSSASVGPGGDQRGPIDGRAAQHQRCRQPRNIRGPGRHGGRTAPSRWPPTAPGPT